MDLTLRGPRPGLKRETEDNLNSAWSRLSYMEEKDKGPATTDPGFFPSLIISACQTTHFDFWFRKNTNLILTKRPRSSGLGKICSLKEEAKRVRSLIVKKTWTLMLLVFLVVHGCDTR